jgi:hypothetical protein
MLEDLGLTWSDVGNLVIMAILFSLACLAFFPWYGVWAAHKEGEAELAKANNEQKIQSAQANGRLQAAKANKEAAIIEAEAVAEQIKRIGQNLQKHDLYLKWQWIKMMEERPEASTIYVPTEANLPILEAARLQTQRSVTADPDAVTEEGA